MQHKKIGILGGMGPEASAEFYMRIIRYCQKKYNAVQDTDYPPMVLYSLGLKGFDESGIVDHQEVLSQLAEGIKTLRDAGCDFIVMPCNTVHHYISELRALSSVPVLSIIEETVKKIDPGGISKVGLLASESTIRLEIYQKHMCDNGILFRVPEEKDYPLINSFILEIMSGNVKSSTKQKMLTLVDEMKDGAINALVLGCTEMPLAMKKEDVGIEVYDTLQILAEAAVEYSFSD